MYQEVFCDKTQFENREVFMKYFSKYGRVLNYKKGEIIDFHGKKFVALVLKGKIVTGISSESGKRKDLFYDRSGEIFGDTGFFYGDMGFLFHEAKEDSTICLNTESEVNKIIAEFPEIYKYILSSMTELFRIITLELSNLVFNDSMGKIADALIRLAVCTRSDYLVEKKSSKAVNNDTMMINMIFTHDELARNIGCSRTTVTLCLKQLQEDNIIFYKNKKICINKADELAKYIDKVF